MNSSRCAVYLLRHQRHGLYDHCQLLELLGLHCHRRILGTTKVRECH